MYLSSLLSFKKGIRLFIVLPLIFFHVCLFAAQDSVFVTLRVVDSRVEDVFLEIEKQTGVVFTYSPTQFDGNQRISISLQHSTIENAMNKILAGKEAKWIKKNNNIVIIAKNPPRNLPTDTLPKVTVIGIVTDKTGKPLPGATLSIKGGNIFAISESDGRFSLTEIASNAILVVSNVGYEKKEITIRGSNPMVIEMEKKITDLKNVEVVSTGYQEIPKERATGSFVQLNNEAINRSVSTNILDRLKGIANGLNFITPTNGSNRTDIQIRGVSTITANAKPLIVVDGFPYGERDGRPGFQSNNESMLGVDNLNPNDILSITILKDAAAASIWGARAGNGVIVITTKKGKYNQTPKIQFGSNLTITEKPNIFYQPTIESPEIISLETNLFNKGYYDDYLYLYPTLNLFPVVPQVVEILHKEKIGEINRLDAAKQIDDLKKTDIRDYVNKYLLRNSVNQQYTLSISGGGQKHNYYTSVGYDKNKNSLPETDYYRITTRLENNFLLLKKLEINSHLNITQTKNNNGSNLPLSNSPYTKLTDSYGTPLAIARNLRMSYIDTAAYPALLDWHYVPLNELKKTSNKLTGFDARFGTSVKYSIISGLDISAGFQYQKMIANGEQYYDSESWYVRDLINQYMSIGRADNSIAYPIPIGSILDRSNSESRQLNFRTQLSLNKVWGRHSITSIAGYETRETHLTDLGGSRLYGYNSRIGSFKSNLNFDSLYIIRPSGTGRIPTGINDLQNILNRYTSSYANVSYSFENKYTITASARLDGSNLFGVKANQRITPLWSTGISWNISQEPFYSVNWLPLFKLRSTYGYNGNMRNDITAFSTIAYQTPSGTALTNAIFANIISPGNPQLRWEKVGVLNLAADFQTKNNRVGGSIEYYSKKAVDLLGSIYVDPTVGVRSFQGNYASIKGQGLDLAINMRNFTRELLWSTSLLFSWTTDRVVDYGFAAKPTDRASSYLGSVPVIGKPLYSIFSYRWAGLDPTTGDPRIYINDTATSYNDGYNSSKGRDLIYNGPKNPTYYGAILNTFSYKNLSISINLTYQLGFYFRRASINYEQLLALSGSHGHKDYLQRWQKNGDEKTTNIPSLPSSISIARDFIYENSDILIEKGDNIRLQDIKISYTINQLKSKYVPLKDIQLYIYANNLGVVWKQTKKEIDPSYGNTIPPAKSISIGLNVNL